MRYTVVWTKAALGHLTNVYLHAPDSQAVTKAVNRIDLALKDGPEAKANHLGGSSFMKILLWPSCSKSFRMTEWFAY